MKPSKIRAFRRRMGWSQEKLAEMLSVDPDLPPVHTLTVGRWERGEADPPQFLRLALERLEQEHGE